MSRFECGGCGHLSTHHTPVPGGGKCQFRGRHGVCKCERLLIPITERELQVLKAVAGGGGIKGAAQKLSLSPKTIEAHLTHMRSKTGLSHANELILAAFRSGLLMIEDFPAAFDGVVTVRQKKAVASA